MSRFFLPVATWFAAERDQHVLWLPVAFGGGIGAWFALPHQAQWIAFLLLAGGGALLALALGTQDLVGRRLATFLLVALLGCAWIWSRAVLVAPERLARPIVTRFAAELLGVEPLAARGIVRLTLRPEEKSGLPSGVRVNVEGDKAPAALRPGALVRLRARLVPPPEAMVPGGYDYARIAWFQGIGATGRALDPVELVRPPPAESGAWARLARWRMELTAHVQRSLPGSGGGIAAALVTGQQGGIAEADADAMRTSGLAHLLSISGLHVAVVVGGVMLVTLRLLALSPRLALRWPLPVIAAGAAAVAGIGYTLLAGAEVPTLRACIAALLVLVALVLGREPLSLRLVAMAALLLLALRPEAIVGPSFQLSFAAAVAIIGLHAHPVVKEGLRRRDEGWPARLARSGAGLFLTGVTVELCLAPIALYHFHRAGLYGALANMVAIPLTSFVIMPLEALALLFDLAGWGAPFWWLTGQALRALLALAHQVAALPGAAAAIPIMPLGAFALMIGGGLWACLWLERPRWLGLGAVVAGAVWAGLATPPDMLVSADGRHMAIRSGERLVLLRPRAGDYARETLAAAAGIDAPATGMDSLPLARCNGDICLAELDRGGRKWRVAATRSAYLLRWRDMMRSCAMADIMVSDRRLPGACRPRWLKIDRAFLAQRGGLAIWLEKPRIRSVRMIGEAHPWTRSPAISRVAGRP